MRTHALVLLSTLALTGGCQGAASDDIPLAAEDFAEGKADGLGLRQVWVHPKDGGLFVADVVHGTVATGKDYHAKVVLATDQKILLDSQSVEYWSGDAVDSPLWFSMSSLDVEVNPGFTLRHVEFGQVLLVDYQEYTPYGPHFLGAKMITCEGKKVFSEKVTFDFEHNLIFDRGNNNKVYELSRCTGFEPSGDGTGLRDDFSITTYPIPVSDAFNLNNDDQYTYGVTFQPTLN